MSRLEGRSGAKGDCNGCSLQLQYCTVFLLGKRCLCSRTAAIFRAQTGGYHFSHILFPTAFFVFLSFRKKSAQTAPNAKHVEFGSGTGCIVKLNCTNEAAPSGGCGHQIGSAMDAEVVAFA